MNAETGTDIQKAKTFLENSELVAIPTETVYGLAGNAFNEHAVLKIFEVKQRPSFDPLIVHIADLDMLNKCVEEIPELAKSLMDTFWPGPLTIIFKKKNIIPDIVTSGLDTVGIRMPEHSLTIQLLKQLDFPLAAPSANPFGYISPTTAQHVFDQLGNKIPYILDGGDCRVGVESTIVEIQDKKCIVYRLGGLTVEYLRNIIPDVELRINSSSDPKAPGMLKSHYAPTKIFVIGDIKMLSLKYPEKKIAHIYFKRSSEFKASNVESFPLSETENLNEAAHSLFALMRLIDKRNDLDLIVAETVPEEGIGRAINDRMKRASSEIS